MSCASRDAGAWDEMGGPALGVHPFDLDQSAAMLHAALTMPTAERSERASQLRARAAARTPNDWLADQIKVARGT